jgi:hypothetical protein
MEGQIGQRHDNSWNGLVRCGISIAVERGHTISDLRRWIRAQVKEVHDTEHGYQPVAGTSVSVQGRDSNDAWADALRLARELGVPIQVRFRWQNKEGAANPGREGSMDWAP